MSAATCGNCRFFLSAEGECRRYPPTSLLKTGRGVIGDYAETVMRWPAVAAKDWCGEHRERERQGELVVTSEVPE